MQYFSITTPTGKTEIKLPSNWSEVTLAQFQKIVALKDFKEEEQKATELSILSGENVDFIKSLPKSKVEQMLSHVGMFLNFQSDWDEVKEFSHNGTDYYFPDWTYNEMTWGEWMDAQTIKAIKTEIENNTFENAHLLMAVLCRKKGFPIYNSDEVQGVAEDFKTLPMDLVFRFVSFFLLQRKNWLKSLGIFSTLLSGEQTKESTTLQGSDIMDRLSTLLVLAGFPLQDLQTIRQLNEQNLENALPT